jgi:hypothetical protein
LVIVNTLLKEYLICLCVDDFKSSSTANTGISHHRDTAHSRSRCAAHLSGPSLRCPCSCRQANNPFEKVGIGRLDLSPYGRDLAQLQPTEKMALYRRVVSMMRHPAHGDNMIYFPRAHGRRNPTRPARRPRPRTPCLDLVIAAHLNGHFATVG